MLIYSHINKQPQMDTMQELTIDQMIAVDRLYEKKMSDFLKEHGLVNDSDIPDRILRFIWREAQEEVVG